jgi:hypothetical protein
MLHLDRIQRCRQYFSGWGAVNDATAVECDDDSPTASASHDGSDDNSGPGSNDDGHDRGDDDQDEANCTAADLKPGARVHEAKTTKAMDGSTVFTKIELVPAA